MKGSIPIFAFKLLLICPFLFAGNAIAGSTTSKISYVQVNSGDSGNPNLVAIEFETPPVDSPVCATGNRMIVSLDEPGGAGILSVALAAKAAGMSVNVGGSNDCTGGLEHIAYIRLL